MLGVPFITNVSAHPAGDMGEAMRVVSAKLKELRRRLAVRYGSDEVIGQSRKGMVAAWAVPEQT